MGRQLLLAVPLGHPEHLHQGVVHRLLQHQLKGPAVLQGHGQLLPVLAAGGLFQGANGLDGGRHRRHVLCLPAHQGLQPAVVNGPPGLGDVQLIQALGPGGGHVLLPVHHPGHGQAGHPQQREQSRQQNHRFFLHTPPPFPFSMGKNSRFMRRKTHTAVFSGKATAIRCFFGKGALP